MEVKERLHNVWRCMINRCSGNYDSPFFQNYEKFQIKVCDEWKENFICFYEWVLSNGYKEGLVLDRINTYGNYEPSNCRFVTRRENN